MPDMHQPPTQAANAPVALADAGPRWDDADFALGCECANPALQIEQWGQEIAAPAGATH